MQFTQSITELLDNIEHIAIPIFCQLTDNRNVCNEQPMAADKPNPEVKTFASSVFVTYISMAMDDIKNISPISVFS
jgi:hypothetical protein